MRIMRMRCLYMERVARIKDRDKGRGKDIVNDDAFDCDYEGNQDYEDEQEGDDGDDYEDEMLVYGESW